MLLGQLGESALQIAKLEPHSLSRRERRARITFLQFDARALARVPASEAEMLVVQYREQPSTKIGALLPQVDFFEGTGKAVLDEIVSSDNVSRQCPRVTSETGDQGLDFPVKACVAGIMFRLIELRSAGTAAIVIFRIWLLSVQIHDHAPSVRRENGVATKIGTSLRRTLPWSR